MTKQEIYDQMIGSVYNVENEFADGKPCSELYGRVYDARLRLSERTGIDFEDPDLMEIVERLHIFAEDSRPAYHGRAAVVLKFVYLFCLPLRKQQNQKSAKIFKE